MLLMGYSFTSFSPAESSMSGRHVQPTRPNRLNTSSRHLRTGIPLVSGLGPLRFPPRPERRGFHRGPDVSR